MPDANNDSPPRGGPSRYRSVPASPQHSSPDSQVGSTQSTPANIRPMWRLQFRPDSPHPHYIPIELPQPVVGTPDTDEFSGRTAGYGSGSDIYTSSESSLPSDDSRVSAVDTSDQFHFNSHLDFGEPDEDDRLEAQFNFADPDEYDRLEEYVDEDHVIDLPDWAGEAADLDFPEEDDQLVEFYEPEETEPAAQPEQEDLVDPYYEDESVDAGESHLTNTDAGSTNEPPQSEASDSGDDPPPLQREQSHVSTTSMSTIIETPFHPSVPLPGDASLSPAQRVWGRRNIRMRILSYMEIPTLEDMCLVSRRTYIQAMTYLARSFEYQMLQEIEEKFAERSKGSDTRRRWILRSMRDIAMPHDQEFVSWAKIKSELPGLRSITFDHVAPNGKDVYSTALVEWKRTSRRGKKTIIVIHPESRNINSIYSDPDKKAHAVIPPDYEVIHRYQFQSDEPLFNKPSNGSITDFSPLGDHIWGIQARKPMSFSFAYEQLKLCVDKRRCPRKFHWHHVRLCLQQMTLAELYTILRLLEDDHLIIEEFTVDLAFKAKDTFTTNDFMIAGPELWRLLNKFHVVSLDFRHEAEPMPRPGKGRRGMSQWMAHEYLNNIQSFSAFGALPLSAPLEKWKWSFECIFGNFMRCILPPWCTYTAHLDDEALDSSNSEGKRLYKDLDVGPVWAEFWSHFQSEGILEFIWEWEHGSKAPAKRKIPTPGWFKMSAKAPESQAEEETGLV